MFVQLLTSHLLKDPQAHPNYAVTAEEETLRTELVKTMEVDELKFFEDKIAEIEKERVKRERGVPGSIAAMRTRRAELKEQGTPKKKRKSNKQQSASLEESNRRLASFEHEDSVVLEDIDPPIDSDQISSQADQDEKMSGVEEESESDEEVQDEGDVDEVEVSAGDESLEESVITADGEEEEDDSSDDSFGYVSN